MSKNKTVDITQINIDQEQKEIVAIKKLITQLTGTILRNKDLLSTQDQLTLNEVLNILDNLIKEKNSLMKKRQRYDKKVINIAKKLEEEINKLNDREKLSYILIQNLNTFTFDVDTLEKGINEFIEIAAKNIYKRKVTPQEYLQSLKQALTKNNSKYSQYLSIYNEKLIEFEID